MNRRTRILKLLRNTSWAIPYADLEAMGDAILADGWAPEVPAIVDSDDELDALPLGSVIRHETTGVVYTRTTKSSFCWVSTQQSGREMSEQVLTRGPVQLIYVAPKPVEA